MNKNALHILLVDDDADFNHFHMHEIKKVGVPSVVLTKNTVIDALEYLKSMDGKKDPLPDLIFLDINMPLMNGWEFLHEYSLLDTHLKGKTIIIILTTSNNPRDVARSRTLGFVSDCLTKPLTQEIMEGIINKYFKE